MILVVSATGQVGSLVVRRLREQGRAVRALVRRAGPAATDLTAIGAELALGDLRDAASITAALHGVEVRHRHCERGGTDTAERLSGDR